MEQVAKLDEAIKNIANITKETNSSVASSLRLMGGNIGKTTKEVEGLAAAWGNANSDKRNLLQRLRNIQRRQLSVLVSAPALMAADVVAACDYRPSTVPVPGGHLGGSTGALLGAGAGAYSLYEALSEMQDIASKGLANVYPEGSQRTSMRSAMALLHPSLRKRRSPGLPLATKVAKDGVGRNQE